MRRHRFIGLWGIVALGAAASAPAENVPALDPAAGLGQTGAIAERDDNGDCRRCHYCNEPTAQNTCLMHICTRGQVRDRDSAGRAARGPEVVCIDVLQNAYLPVPFDHEGHAKMAEMGKGCVTCHHFTPEGEQPPACATCHELEAGTDIHKPGLKGAYHQQCMNCHREWVDETNCAVCHVARAGRATEEDVARSRTRDDILGRNDHPPIPEPEGDFYRSGAGQDRESRVIFRHEQHVRRFGINCVDCHHESSCARCHTRNVGPDRPRTLAEHHRPCLRCHKNDMDGSNPAARCDRCHWKEGQPKPKPFDHADVGWPLRRYHEGQGCRQCHVRVPFTKLNGACNNCHGEWSPSTFDHRVTGQVLDDNHEEVDCADCHTGRAFDRPPTCVECHDPEDGISFPARRPGPVFDFQTSKADHEDGRAMTPTTTNGDLDRNLTGNARMPATNNATIAIPSWAPNNPWRKSRRDARLAGYARVLAQGRQRQQRHWGRRTRIWPSATMISAPATSAGVTLLNSSTTSETTVLQGVVEGKRPTTTP